MPTPDTRNYTLGRGKVFFAPFKPGTQEPGAERYLGNTPDLAWTAEIEELDHFNSDEGIREKDDSVTLQVDRSGSVTTDNIAMENLALFWFGTSSLVTVTAATSATDTIDGPTFDGQYQLGTSASAPAGLRNLSNVVLTLDPDGAATALTLGSDYTVDLVRGRVTFLEDGALTGDGTEEVGATFDVAGYTMPRVVSGNQPIEGSLRFEAHNPKGKNIDYFLPWAKLTPDGDYSLKGDDWQQMTMNIEILKKGDLAAVYADGEATLIP